MKFKFNMNVLLVDVSVISQSVIFSIFLLLIYSCSGETNNSNKSSLDYMNISNTDIQYVKPTKQITSIIIKNSSDESNVFPFTCGQVFKKGDIPADKTIAAEDADGNVIPLQADIKALHDDGSVRHVILSSQLSLKGGETKKIFLGPGRKNSNPSVDLQHLLDNDFNATVTIIIGSIEYFLSVGELLQSQQPVAWLSGGIVSEWHMKGLIKTSDGVEHPHLSVHFYVRMYSNKNIRLSVVVENNFSFINNPSNINYDCIVSVNGREKINQSVTHFRQSRWKRTFWTDGKPSIQSKHNYSYLASTKAIPHYDQTVSISETAINNLKSKWNNESKPYDIMKIGFIEPYMPTTGSRPEIGPFPAWTAIYLMTMDETAKEVTLGHGDQAGSWSIHYRDSLTELPVSLDDYPYMTILGNPQDACRYEGDKQVCDNFATCESSCDTEYTHDTAHQPSLAFIPYLVTGDYYYLEELQFWANYNIISLNPGYRNYIKGHISGQVRGQAWSLRTLAQAAYITPDDHPLKSYFIEKLSNNNDNYYNRYVLNEDGDANPLGWIYPLYTNYAGNTEEISPWMDDFFTWAVGYIIGLGFNEWKSFFEYKARYPIGRMVGEGFCYVHGASYRQNAGAVLGGEQYTTWPDFYQGVLNKYGYEDLLCGSQNMADDINAVSSSNYSAGSMTGYPLSATGYPSNMQPALAVAVDIKVEKSADAWEQFISRKDLPDYSSEPQFAIIPCK